MTLIFVLWFCQPAIYGFIVKHCCEIIGTFLLALYVNDLLVTGNPQMFLQALDE